MVSDNTSARWAGAVGRVFVSLVRDTPGHSRKDSIVSDDIDDTTNNELTNTPQGEPADRGDEPRPAQDTTDEGRVARTVARFERNLAIRGTLRIHHINRDINVPCDGFHALAVIEHFAAHTPNGASLDDVSPLTSDAECGWTVLDYDGVVGMTWIAELEVLRSTRVAFDPR